jgi:hypothetical protein
MGSRITGFLLLGAAWVMTACDRGQDVTPTGPEFAGGKSACDFTLLQKDADAEFPKAGGNPTNQTVSSLLSDMKSFYTAGDSSGATLKGYQVLDIIANKGHDVAQGGSGSPEFGAALAFDLLVCMTVGDPKPAVTLAELTSALSPDSGAFAVRGTSATDSRSVRAHDGHWVLGPPIKSLSPTVTRYAWSEILTGFSPTPALNNPGSDLEDRMLIIGRRVTSDYSNFTIDPQTQEVIFDWKSIPTAAFDVTKGGVVSGYCGLDDQVTSQFVQHFSQLNTLVEVLGFAEPDCSGPLFGLRKAAPTTLAGRLLGLFAPAPAYAAVALLTNTGGGKGALSPDAIIAPGAVEIVIDKQPAKSGTVVLAFHPISSSGSTVVPLKISITSAGDIRFKQPGVLVYAKGIVNNGVPGITCANYAYTDKAGVATFTNLFITKAGGYSLVFANVGTESASGVPEVPAAASLTTIAFNLKNATTLGNPCPVYDPNRGATGNGQYNLNVLAAGGGTWVDGFPPAN